MVGKVTGGLMDEPSSIRWRPSSDDRCTPRTEQTPVTLTTSSSFSITVVMTSLITCNSKPVFHYYITTIQHSCHRRHVMLQDVR